MTPNPICWFEIPAHNLDRAQGFYETVLQLPLRRETMGPTELAIFPYDASQGGVGGALMRQNAPATTHTPAHTPAALTPYPSGTLVYLNANPSLQQALERVVPQGGTIELPIQALPPGMGFFAHITDTEGNRVGLHAQA